MIKENLAALLENISDIARAAGRDSGDVSLIGVSKTFGMDKILEAYNAGLKDFGENRIQEAKDKIEKIDADIRWHFIGHLQTNKAKTAVRLFDVIHSVDSVRLAEALDKHCGTIGRERIDILLQVNIAREPQKSGIDPEDVMDAVKEMMHLKHARLAGLMTIPPYTENKEETRKHYKRLRELRDNTNSTLNADVLKELSMGMSNDYDVAIEEGSTYVRVGTALFGGRDYPFK
jgi:pyridoxal phosphate enzyme (YggS family)